MHLRSIHFAATATQTLTCIDLIRHLFWQILEDNPLADFVELPEQLAGLKYSNLLCGVIRGALEMVRAGQALSAAFSGPTLDAVGLFYARRCAGSVVMCTHGCCGCKSYPACDKCD